MLSRPIGWMWSLCLDLIGARSRAIRKQGHESAVVARSAHSGSYRMTGLGLPLLSKTAHIQNIKFWTLSTIWFNRPEFGIDSQS